MTLVQSPNFALINRISAQVKDIRGLQHNIDPKQFKLHLLEEGQLKALKEILNELEEAQKDAALAEAVLESVRQAHGQELIDDLIL